MISSDYEKKIPASRFAVAPMLDRTDRHCRFFYRQLTKKTLLYSEMIVADAIIHGDRKKLLDFLEEEKPIALQLGGADLEKLAEASRIGESFGYDEINLNAGCPSVRVKSGSFGACLMLSPDIAGRAVEAIKKAVNIPVTVKCRIGVDNQDSEIALDKFGECILKYGADAVWVHARKAWLNGLSPQDNREIPPLDYSRVYRFRKKNPGHFTGINGGIRTLEEALVHLQYVDGVMIGRAVYDNPLLLANVDHMIFGMPPNSHNYRTLIETMATYIDRCTCSGVRLSQIVRHMLGLFRGYTGARHWRKILSTQSHISTTTSSVLYEALEEILQAQQENENKT